MAYHPLKLTRRHVTPGQRLTRTESWTPRECPGFEPESSLGNRIAVWGCVVLLGVAIASQFFW